MILVTKAFDQARQRGVCVCVCIFIKLHITILCVCACVFIKLHITAQSGPVILVILCHSH